MGLATPSRRKANSLKNANQKKNNSNHLNSALALEGIIMTSHDESRVPSEVMRPMHLLTTRATIFIGTWNVRTMWETGRVFQISAEMRKYNLEVLGISETHWTQVGQQRLSSGELLLYSGHEEENAPHTQGVALMLSRKALNALIGW